MAELKKRRRARRGIQLVLRLADWSSESYTVEISRRENVWRKYTLSTRCQDIRLSDNEMLDLIALLQEARRLP